MTGSDATTSAETKGGATATEKPVAKVRTRPGFSHDNGDPTIALWMGLMSIGFYYAFTCARCPHYMRCELSACACPLISTAWFYSWRVCRYFNGGLTAEASHILVKDEGKAKDLLRQLNRGADFAKLAAEHSTCPSGARAGGSLGSFSKGRMVDGFDEVVFSEDTPIGDVIGPVKTQFGYHLIKVHKREGKVDSSPTKGKAKS